MSPPRLPSGYRNLERTGPDPVTEADAIVELMARSAAFRRRLLVLSLACSLLGGVAGAYLYVALATTIYGRVTGAAFAVGGLLSFTVLHRLSGALARSRERRWIAELSGRHQLDTEPLAEAAAMLK